MLYLYETIQNLLWQALYEVSESIMLYTLNLCNVVCQLYTLNLCYVVCQLYLKKKGGWREQKALGECKERQLRLFFRVGTKQADRS